MLHEPELVFLDEPTTGLDVDVAREIQGLIKSLVRDGKTVFLTTHNMQEVEDLCDEIAVIDQGRLTSTSTMADVKRRHAGRTVAVELEDRTERITLDALADFMARNPGVVSVHSEEGSVEEFFLEMVRKTDARERV